MITKQEILDWIEFLYKDLLTYRVFIGGYYFTFDQLDDFFQKKSLLQQKISQANNQVRVNTYLLNKIPLTDLTARLNKEIKKLKEKSNFVTDKIKAITKYNEIIELPVTFEELDYVYNNLAYMKDELDTFYNFVLEEFQQIHKGQENDFFIFLNDIAQELKDSLMYGLKEAKLLHGELPRT